jgi:hypothetical protein
VTVDTNALGRLLLIAGAGLCLVGLIVLGLGKLPSFGRLPGDLRIEREGFSCFVPLVSMALVSLVLTVVVNLILWLLSRR